MKNKPLIVHDLADEEASEAFAYYGEIDAEIAARFKVELGRCLASIELRPLTFQIYLRDARRCLLKGFPYSVVFQETTESWFVIAVAHVKRRPGYWKRRVGGTER